jgi:hypothetical protein
MTIKNCRWMAAAAAVLALVSVPAHAAKVTRISAPGIGCAGATQASTTLQVCGGATGASAGFSVQWMTAADYVFRSFAHATSTLSRSDFTPDLSCSTLACGQGGGCTRPADDYWRYFNPPACVNNPAYLHSRIN